MVSHQCEVWVPLVTSQRVFLVSGASRGICEGFDFSPVLQLVETRLDVERQVDEKMVL